MVPQRVCNTLIDEYGWLQSEKDPNRPGYYLYSLTSTGITAIDTIDSLSAKHDYATGTLMQTVSNNMDMLVAADGSREKQIEQVTKSIEMLEERRNRLLAGERVYLMDDEKYQNECITLIGELKYFPASLRKTAEDLAEIRRDFQKKVLDTPYSGADISELYRMKDSILESTEGGRNFRDVQAIINNTSESRLSATMDCILSSDRLQSNPSLKRDLDYAWRSVLNSVLYVIDQLVKTQSLVANCLASLMNDNMLITYEKLHETSEMVRAWYAQARPRDYVELPNYMLRLNITHLRTNFGEPMPALFQGRHGLSEVGADFNVVPAVFCKPSKEHVVESESIRNIAHGRIISLLFQHRKALPIRSIRHTHALRNLRTRASGRALGCPRRYPCPYSPRPILPNR